MTEVTEHPSSPPPRISGVVVARNEETRIGFALASVRPLVDEIIFFDMESSDGTGAIAESYGATVFCVPAIGAQEPARPEAVAKANGEWILMFDADEVLTEELRNRLRQIVHDNSADVVSLPRKNYLFGKAMTGALMGANDDRQIRFFKKDAATVSPLLHLQPAIHPGSRLVQLHYPEDGAIVHFNYLDITNYLTKFARYTQMESVKPSALDNYGLGRTIMKAGWEFINRYFLKAGYRDGWRGLYISLSMSFYRLTIWARVLELQESGTREQIEAIYAREARSVLASGAKE